MNKGHIAILQLARSGDIIQTLIACKDIKKKNPNTIVTLVTRKEFSSFMLDVISPYFDQIIEIEADFFKESNTKNWANSDHVTRMNTFKIDVLVNLTFDRASSMLAGKIMAKHYLGPHLNQDNELVIQDTWSHFVYSQVLGGKYCPYNLVDLFKHILGVNVEEHSPIDTINKGHRVVVHPFASDAKKRWGTHKWIETIYSVMSSRKESFVTIIGSQSEFQQASDIKNHELLKKFQSRMKIIASKDCFTEIAQEIESCSLFIGNDSLYSHVAALYQKPSVIISLGPVKSYETAPYNNNAFILAPNINCYPCEVSTQCELLPCHGKISHQLVSSMANSLLHDLKEMGEIPEALLTTVDIFKVEIYEKVGLDLINLVNRPAPNHELLRRLYRVMWNFQLHDLELHEPIPALSENAQPFLKSTTAGITKTFQLYQHAIDLCKDLVKNTVSDTPSVTRVKEISAKLAEIDQLSNVLRSAFPSIAPIIDFTMVQKSSFAGPKLVDIASGQLGCFQFAQHSLMILSELIGTTIAPYLPKDKMEKKQIDEAQ